VHKFVATLLGFLVTCLLLSTLAVSVNGAALNVGSGGQYKSITEAIIAAQPGDTITVGAGTYTENIIVTKSITIKAASPGSTVVTAADPSKDVFLVQAKDVRIEGLTLTGATGASGVHVDHVL
jgi:nitrous oxidase accessory protein NosD